MTSETNKQNMSTPAHRLLRLVPMLTRQTGRRHFGTRQAGARFSLEYKLYCEENGRPVSYWHDVPLLADRTNRIFNMVVEIPRWSNAKLEINKAEPLNPICQDSKKGKLRFVKNVFPHKGYIHNYGALPQTWESPLHPATGTGLPGDNDPIDVCEIGSRVAQPGDIKQVKVLGVIALIDEGETDWKIIAIDVKDPLAGKMSDIGDVEELLPGLLDATRDWFARYKMPDGKPKNEFAFNGEYKDAAFALQIIEECHKSWQELVKGELPSERVADLQIASSLGYSKQVADISAVDTTAALPDAPVDPAVDKWYYV